MNGRKLAGRLAARQAAHVKTTKTGECADKSNRWENGGFKRPGSFKKNFPRGRKRSHK